MKKIITMMMVLAMIMALTACSPVTTNETESTTVETVEDVEDVEAVSERFAVYQCRFFPEAGEIVTSDGDTLIVENPEILNYDADPYEGIPVAIGVEGDPENVESWEVLGVVYDRETAIYDQLETAFNAELDGYKVERIKNHITISKE